MHTYIYIYIYNPFNPLRYVKRGKNRMKLHLENENEKQFHTRLILKAYNKKKMSSLNKKRCIYMHINMHNY